MLSTSETTERRPASLPRPKDIAVGADDRAAAYFQEVKAAFDRAGAAAGVCETDLLLAGAPLRLRSAGPALLRQVMPALAHLRRAAADTTGGLTVYLWDSASSGIDLPAPPWRQQDLIARGDVLSMNGRRWHTAYQQDVPMLSMCDLEQGVAVLWLGDAAAMPYWESASPLRSILHWWAAARGFQVVHAAAVGTPDGGLLLGGASGSGKSTTALACLNSDLQYAGDDCVLVQAAQPWVHSLYCTGKLFERSLELLPWLADAVANPDRPAEFKAVLQVDRAFPARLTEGFPLRAVVLPRVTGGPCHRLTPLAPAAALRALAPSTIYALPASEGGSFRMLTGLVQRLPCFSLQLGDAVAELPGLLGGLLRDLPSCADASTLC